MSQTNAELAARAWRAMSQQVLDHDRKVAVSEVLGLSFARIRALRRLTDEPLTLRELSERLTADPPYVTLMIDDLEDRGLVERRPHPSDRRAKLVELTPAGREIAAQANAILDEPIAELSKLPKKDLEVIVRALEQLGDARQQPST